MNLTGVAVLVAFYYNFFVLEVYLFALFWAAIVSIPLFQIKLGLIELADWIWCWWCGRTYKVLQVDEEGQPVKLQLERLTRWAPVGVDGLAAPSSPVAEPLVLELSEELEKQLMEERNQEKDLHAVVRPCKARASSEDLAKAPEHEVVQITTQGHLGPLRPYQSVGDLLDWWPCLWSALTSLGSWLFRPFEGFREGKAGSEPLFGILMRLCAVQFGMQFLWPDWIEFLGQLLLRRVLGPLLGARVFSTALHWLLPWLLGSERCNAAWNVFCGAVVQVCWLADCFAGITSKFRSSCWKTIEASRDSLLSLVIIAASLIMGLQATIFLTFSLVQEVSFIRDFNTTELASHEVFQGAATRVMEAAKNVTQTNDGVIWLPRDSSEAIDAVVLLAARVAIWAGSWLGFQTGRSADVDCAEVMAFGAECIPGTLPAASPSPDMFRNTTACLKLILSGNVTEARDLITGAYAETVAFATLIGLLAPGSETEGHAQWLAGALPGWAWEAKSLMNRGLALFLAPFNLGSWMVATALSSAGQAIVFLTALFYLLSAKASCLLVIGEFLCVVDPSQNTARISERVVRAVLLSALKMSAFHAMFTWLLFSFCQLRGCVQIVMVPTVLSALMAFLPVVSPVLVSACVPPLFWYNNHTVSAVLAAVANIFVWWQVPTAIYEEIPESNSWLTGLSVVLGIRQFGVAGVVLGPMIASVPLIVFNLLKHFNRRQDADAATVQRQGRLSTDDAEQVAAPLRTPASSSSSRRPAQMRDLQRSPASSSGRIRGSGEESRHVSQGSPAHLLQVPSDLDSLRHELSEVSHEVPSWRAPDTAKIGCRAPCTASEDSEGGQQASSVRKKPNVDLVQGQGFQEIPGVLLQVSSPQSMESKYPDDPPAVPPVRSKSGPLKRRTTRLRSSGTSGGPVPFRTTGGPID